MFRKSRKIIFFVVIAMLLMFPGSAFPNVVSVLHDLSADLRLNPPPGINPNAQGLSLALFYGPGNQVNLDESNNRYNSYKIKLAGTYYYRVTSNPTSLFYGATKLIHITQAQIDNEAIISMHVLTGVRPTGTETFDAPFVNVFTDQIIDRLFGTVEILKDFPADGLKTPVFTTQKGLWQHSTQADLMKFVTDAANSNPNVHLFSLGKTQTLGYDIPILIFTSSIIPEGSTFEQAAEVIRENNKVTFFYQGHIHGDEVSSSEGAMAFILEMAGAYGAQFLDKVNVVCIPRLNVEGAARNTRASLSPVIEMDSDHLRSRAPEIRMVHKAYLEIMPEVVMDGHEIDYYSVSFTYVTADIAYAMATGGITDLEATPSTSMNNPSMELNDFAVNTVANKLHADLAVGGIRSDHYENASNGWTSNHSVGRAYYGLMGSVSMIVGVRGGATHLMARRAWAHVMAAKSMLETLYANDVEIKTLVKKGRDDTIAKGKKFDPNEKVYLYQYASGATPTYYIQGAENPGAKYSNYKLMRYQATMHGELVKVNSTDENMIIKSLAINDASHFDRSRPTAYVIPKGLTNTTVNSGDYAINYDYLLEMLQSNRIEYHELSPGTTAPLRQYYRVSGAGTASTAMNATINADVLRADLRPEEMVFFKNGAYVIPMDQVTGSVIMCTFEPDITNSNGFNGTVAQSLNDSEGLAIVFYDLLTNNYPYYRFEGDNPRVELSDENCKDRIKGFANINKQEISLSENADGAGWSWNAAANTLTLTGGNYDLGDIAFVTSVNITINMTGNTTAKSIVNTGSGKLTITSASGGSLTLDSDTGSAISAIGDIEINGGSVYAAATSENASAIESMTGSVIIGGTANVTANAVDGYGAAINAAVNINISTSGNVKGATDAGYSLKASDISITNGITELFFDINGGGGAYNATNHSFNSANTRVYANGLQIYPYIAATLKVSFQSRVTPSAANVEKLMVKWISGNAVVAEEMVTADQNGEVEAKIPMLNTGLTIWVKGERSLAASQYVGTVQNGNVINIGTLLCGDSNGDNMIDLNDFNTFLNNYGYNSNLPGFNQFADFNNDGVVDLGDFNIFLINYGKTGAQLPSGYSPSAISKVFINEESKEITVNKTDSGSGCNMGFIAFALIMLSSAPLFRKK